MNIYERSISHINNEWKLTTTETLKSDGKISAWMVNVESEHGELSLPAPGAAKTTKYHSRQHLLMLLDYSSRYFEFVSLIFLLPAQLVLKLIGTIIAMVTVIVTCMEVVATIMTIIRMKLSNFKTTTMVMTMLTMMGMDTEKGTCSQ